MKKPGPWFKNDCNQNHPPNTYLHCPHLISGMYCGRRADMYACPGGQISAVVKDGGCLARDALRVRHQPKYRRGIVFRAWVIAKLKGLL